MQHLTRPAVYPYLAHTIQAVIDALEATPLMVSTMADLAWINGDVSAAVAALVADDTVALEGALVVLL